MTAIEGEYPKEAPFTISELEEIYPCASGKSKEDEEYRNEGSGGNSSAAAGKTRIHGAVESYHAGFCDRP